MKIELTFTGGGQTVVDVDEWSMTKNPHDGLQQVRWITGTDTTRKLLYVNVDQIAAVVRIFDAELTDAEA